MTVKEIRKITGLSQAAFAARYEIPTRTVEDWEAGARKPAPYLVKLLERAVCEDYDVKIVIGPVSGMGSGGRSGEGGLCVPAPASGGSGRVYKEVQRGANVPGEKAEEH